MSNLKETYKKELIPVLQEKLGMKNVMAVPKLTKVVQAHQRMQRRSCHKHFLLLFWWLPHILVSTVAVHSVAGQHAQLRVH